MQRHTDKSDLNKTDTKHVTSELSDYKVISRAEENFIGGGGDKPSWGGG